MPFFKLIHSEESVPDSPMPRRAATSPLFMRKVF
jgi:hypothetical protein